jgi:hypothetical protein
MIHEPMLLIALHDVQKATRAQFAEESSCTPVPTQPKRKLLARVNPLVKAALVMIKLFVGYALGAKP